MTEPLYQQDAYRRDCTATITEILEDGVVVDRTVFYPLGGGQPGDRGALVKPDNTRVEVIDTRHIGDGRIKHVTADAGGLRVGDQVLAEIDWDLRNAHMRMHTCLHLLGAVVSYGVTGGNISATRSRLDFDMQETLNKYDLTQRVNALIEADHDVSTRWITQQELANQPELIRTMSVKPPAGVPRIRLLQIADIDLQPCGGTHVAHTGEIGPISVAKVEKKGRHNRRVHIVFA